MINALVAPAVNMSTFKKLMCQFFKSGPAGAKLFQHALLDAFVTK
jgi:hypothetical protein